MNCCVCFNAGLTSLYYLYTLTKCTMHKSQVANPEAQDRVMIEAVENHMPQVIIIDEISTEAECMAARTIAQRGALVGVSCITRHVCSPAKPVLCCKWN